MIFLILAIIVLLSVGIIYSAGIIFNKSSGSFTAFEKQTTAEKVYSIIVLVVMLAGCGALGLMGAGEVMPIILVPFLLFFFVCIYTAKEDRAKQYSLLEEMNEKLKEMEKELANLKGANEIKSSEPAYDMNTEEENSNSDQI